MHTDARLHIPERATPPVAPRKVTDTEDAAAQASPALTRIFFDGVPFESERRFSNGPHLDHSAKQVHNVSFIFKWDPIRTKHTF